MGYVDNLFFYDRSCECSYFKHVPFLCSRVSMFLGTFYIDDLIIIVALRETLISQRFISLFSPSCLLFLEFRLNAKMILRREEKCKPYHFDNAREKTERLSRGENLKGDGGKEKGESESGSV